MQVGTKVRGGWTTTEMNAVHPIYKGGGWVKMNKPNRQNKRHPYVTWAKPEQIADKLEIE